MKAARIEAAKSVEELCAEDDKEAEEKMRAADIPALFRRIHWHACTHFSTESADDGEMAARAVTLALASACTEAEAGGAAASEDGASWDDAGSGGGGDGAVVLFEDPDFGPAVSKTVRACARSMRRWL